MSTHIGTTGPDDGRAPAGELLPPDIRSIGAMLDRLGAIEGDCARDGLEARVAEASWVARIGGRMDELGEQERAGAPAELEPRVHAASAPELPAPGTAPEMAGARRHGAGREQRTGGRRGAGRRVWAVRAAAIMLLCGAGVLALIATRPGQNSGPAISDGTGVTRGGAPLDGTAVEVAAAEPTLDESVFALLASIDRATMGDQIESLRSDVDGLSVSTLSEPPVTDRLFEGAM